jgi:hypothetical protein
LFSPASPVLCWLFFFVVAGAYLQRCVPQHLVRTKQRVAADASSASG